MFVSPCICICVFVLLVLVLVPRDSGARRARHGRYLCERLSSAHINSLCVFVLVYLYLCICTCRCANDTNAAVNTYSLRSFRWAGSGAAAARVWRRGVRGGCAAARPRTGGGSIIMYTVRKTANGNRAAIGPFRACIRGMVVQVCGIQRRRHQNIRWSSGCPVSDGR